MVTEKRWSYTHDGPLVCNFAWRIFQTPAPEPEFELFNPGMLRPVILERYLSLLHQTHYRTLTADAFQDDLKAHYHTDVDEKDVFPFNYCLRWFPDHIDSNNLQHKDDSSRLQLTANLKKRTRADAAFTSLDWARPSKLAQDRADSVFGKRERG